MNQRIKKIAQELAKNHYCNPAEQCGLVHDIEWEIERLVKPLIDALEFYAEVFPAPMEVTAHKKEDSKFAKLSEDLLNCFHTKAREALDKFKGEMK